MHEMPFWVPQLVFSVVCTIPALGHVEESVELLHLYIHSSEKQRLIWLLCGAGCDTNLRTQHVLLGHAPSHCNFLLCEYVPGTAGHPHKLSQPAASHTWDHKTSKAA